MAEVIVHLSEENLHHLRQRAKESDQTMDEILNTILASDAEWQQTLRKDSLFSLFGTLDSGDSTISTRVDEIVYQNKTNDDRSHSG